jgi:S-methylmethionine-dependent homocysteine/selenocysteine methylase
MDFVDQIKGAVSGHEDQIEGAIGQGGDFIDSKTDGKYAGQVDQAQNFLKEQLQAFAGDQEALQS